jgi:hypothetical protein
MKTIKSTDVNIIEEDKGTDMVSVGDSEVVYTVINQHLRGCKQCKISDLDRAKSNRKCLLAVIIDIQKNKFYWLGIKLGKLRQLFRRNHFTLCDEKFKM